MIPYIENQLTESILRENISQIKMKAPDHSYSLPALSTQPIALEQSQNPLGNQLVTPTQLLPSYPCHLEKVFQDYINQAKLEWNALGQMKTTSFDLNLVRANTLMKLTSLREHLPLFMEIMKPAGTGTNLLVLNNQMTPAMKLMTQITPQNLLKQEMPPPMPNPSIYSNVQYEGNYVKPLSMPPNHPLNPNNETKSTIDPLSQFPSIKQVIPPPIPNPSNFSVELPEENDVKPVLSTFWSKQAIEDNVHPPEKVKKTEKKIVYIVQCGKCEQIFKYNGKEPLIMHSLLHSSINYFKCREPNCGKMIQTKGKMRSHIMSYHENPFPRGYGLGCLPMTDPGFQKLIDECFGQVFDIREYAANPNKQISVKFQEFKYE